MNPVWKTLWRMFWPGRDGLRFWARWRRGATRALAVDGIRIGADALREARTDIISAHASPPALLPSREYARLLRATYRAFWLQAGWLLVIYGIWLTLLITTHTRPSWFYTIGLVAYSLCHGMSMLVEVAANWRLRNPERPGWREFLAAGDARWPRPR